MKRVPGMIALMASWLVVFWVLSFLTEFVLVPWDTAVVRPETGTWQRTLNDFFEQPPGSLLVPVLLVTGSVILVIRSRQQRFFHFAALNLIFAGSAFALFTVAAMVNNAVFPYPPVLFDPDYRGYYRSVIPGLTVALACAGWLAMQVWIGRKQAR